MSEYRLSDLLDMSIIQKLADSNFSVSGMPMTIVDTFDGSFLVRTGFSDICANFHRACPESMEQCVISDRAVQCHLDQEVHQYRCNNGLWHIAMPIVVSGRHLATMFLTQFWSDREQVDRDYFILQARRYGYELEPYLAALDAMPHFSSEKVDYIVSYDKALVRFMADLAEQSLRVIEARRSLEESELKYRTLVENVPIGVFRIDPSGPGSFIKANPAMLRIFGYESFEDFNDVTVTGWYQSSADRRSYLDLIKQDGMVKDLELPLKKKDGSPIWCSLTATAQYGADGEVQWIDSVIEDITERRKAQEALRKALEEMETRVRERTADLAEVNDLLRIEISERKHFEEKLRELSEIDYLTGIFNRRKLFDIMEAEIGKAHRYSRPLSLIMLDLDHFKLINDSHGHHVGDAVLMDMVLIVRRSLRKVDVFARYGGEEFIVVCAETSLDGALVLAEKIRSAMAASSFPVVGRVTVSAGVAEYRHGDTEAGFIERADRALYAAKRQGRNQVAAV